MDFVGHARQLRNQLSNIGKAIDGHNVRLTHLQLLNICATQAPSATCNFFLLLYAGI